jgi:hypothetical protein
VRQSDWTTIKVKVLTANDHSTGSEPTARIVPIIRSPSNALFALNDHYFVRWICNNTRS